MRDTGWRTVAWFGVLSAAAAGWVLAKSAAAPEPLPYAEIRRFTEVLERVRALYVEEVDDATLLDKAIRGMLEGLDPHSTYFDPEEYRSFDETTRGEFGGLGIEVTMENGFVKVVAPIDDTPAQRAGLKSGDLIIRIDGEPVKGMSLDEAVRRMRGKPGTRIELTVVREGNAAPFKVEIERARIRVKSVRSEWLEPGFAYLRISAFQENTGREVLDHLERLRKEGGKKGIEGLVLDLRNNPGGILEAARQVADAFLDGGLIVYTDGRAPEAKSRLLARPGDVLAGAPIVVLVNAGSASASEIVAGALQDHRRALIMGETTFGKGSVQTILPLDDGGAIKLTTARYFTPKGRSIQAEGIVPDIPVKPARLEWLEEQGAIEPVKEADLKGHLDNPEGERKDGRAQEGATRSERLEEDYLLIEALNLLKGLVLLLGRGG